MKTIQEHRKVVEKISDFAFANAVNSVGIDNLTEKLVGNWGKDEQLNFIVKVHDGFKKAQNLLIEEIQYYQSLLREEKIQLKHWRKEKDKSKENDSKRTIKIITQRLHTYSHIADGIAWQVIGGQLHIARRFHIEEDSTKFLDSSNVEHAISVVNDINKNPLEFALISDLTSFVQIGDVLVKHKEGVKIIELKEGKVNDKVSEFINQLEKEKIPITDKVLEDKFDDKTFKQAKRMQRQKERAKKASEIMNHDKGIDPVSGYEITVSTPNIPTLGYDQEFNKLREILDKKTWAYTVVEGCLHIGMYRDEGIKMAGFAVEQILKQETKNYIIADWLSITASLSQPIFAKPFEPNFITDILTGKIKIIIGLNLDIMIELFNDYGLKTKWMTTKETAKAKQVVPRKGMFVLNNRGISMEGNNKNEESWILYGGIISKIIYDNILPSNIVQTLLTR